MATQCSKLENWSIFNYILLNNYSKVHFWPIFPTMRHIGPIPSWFFWKLFMQGTFLPQFAHPDPFWLNRVWFRTSWTNFEIVCKFLNSLKLLQLCMLIHKIQRKIFNTYVQILSFFKICPWNLKFSYIFRLSPSRMNVESWKKS